MSFEEMNNFILEKIQIFKNDDVRENKFELKNTAIREEYNIKRSFRRGSSKHAQNRNILQSVIKIKNRWRKFGRAKEKRPKLGML